MYLCPTTSIGFGQLTLTAVESDEFHTIKYRSSRVYVGLSDVLSVAVYRVSFTSTGSFCLCIVFYEVNIACQTKPNSIV